LHNGHPNQDVIVQDQDGLNVRRLAVAVGHRHARILPSRRLIQLLIASEVRHRRAARLEFARPGSENAHETYKFPGTAPNGTDAVAVYDTFFRALAAEQSIHQQTAQAGGLLPI
jgi:hypothetical protein